MPSTPPAYASILDANSRASYLAALVSYANSVGFATVDATAFMEHEGRTRDIDIVDNIPSSDVWLSLDPSLGQRCPVMQHCKRQGTPIAWGRQTYHQATGVEDLYDVCSSLGLASGISVAVHLPRGRMLQISLHNDLDAPAPRYNAQLRELVKFSAYATAAASDLLLQLGDVDRIQDLTTVEKEMLKRVADGMPIERVAQQLNLAESVAQEVAEITSRTLGLSSIEAASLRALRLGII